MILSHHWFPTSTLQVLSGMTLGLISDSTSRVAVAAILKSG